MASPSKVSLILCASFVALFVSAKTNAQSADDGFDLKLSTIQEDVRVITVQPDGKILIGGEFATVLGVPRSGMARMARSTAFLTLISFIPRPGTRPFWLLLCRQMVKLLWAAHLLPPEGSRDMASLAWIQLPEQPIRGILIRIVP